MPIAQDMINKNPDIFMLIILSRDLKKIGANVIRDQVCWGKAEVQYNDYNNQTSLRLAERFLEGVKTERPFLLDYLKTEVKNIFPSTYHIYFCDFRTS